MVRVRVRVMGGVFFSKSILGRGRGGEFFFLGGDFFFFPGH
jgi:hypothetical protein